MLIAIHTVVMVSMNALPYLLFRHLGALFCVRAILVKEVTLLPYLAPVVDAAPYLAGMFNLRGTLIPVIDLGFFLGRRAPARVEDSVVICETSRRLIGVTVNEMLDVQEIAPAQRDESLPSLIQGWHGYHLLEGAAALGDEIASILNLDAFLTRIEADHEETLETAPREEAALDGLFAACSPAELAVLHRRAAALSEPLETTDAAGALAVAVIRIENEYLAFELDLIREFTDIHRVTPIPCCPGHIIGSMNLRGSVVTLVDIRGHLTIPAAGKPGTKAVIAATEEGLAGIAVNDALTVTNLRKSEINAAPSAVSIASDYVTGSATLEGLPVTLVDLKKLLLGGELTVNQEV